MKIPFSFSAAREAGCAGDSNDEDEEDGREEDDSNALPRAIPALRGRWRIPSAPSPVAIEEDGTGVWRRAMSVDEVVRVADGAGVGSKRLGSVTRTGPVRKGARWVTAGESFASASVGASGASAAALEVGRSDFRAPPGVADSIATTGTIAGSAGSVGSGFP